MTDTDHINATNDTGSDDTRSDVAGEPPTAAATTERTDFLQALSVHRGFLRHTTVGLTDDQAATRSTVSALSVGGLVKHVSGVETGWARFIVEGTSALSMDDGGFDHEQYMSQFAMQPGETLDGLLAEYEQVAATTDDLVRTLPSLDLAHPLPEAPWFEPGATWSARRVLLHIIAETAQHAGHADIIRETIDGATTMG